MGYPGRCGEYVTMNVAQAKTIQIFLPTGEPRDGFGWRS